MVETHLRVTPRIQIPLSELDFQFARSGGPGGQNVNKVNSKAMMRWNVSESPSISEPLRARFLAKFGSRTDKRGVLLVASQRYRDQNRNVQDCLDRLREMLAEVASPPRIRRPTQPTKGSVAARLQEKGLRARKKQGRQNPRLDRDA